VRGRAQIALLFAALVCCACAPALPVPPYEPQEGASPVVVPFIPPPARVDVIGDPPPGLAHPVWVDGQWTWRGRRWAWEPGEWVELEPKKVYAKPIVVRRSDGQLVWFVGTFREDTRGSISR